MNSRATLLFFIILLISTFLISCSKNEARNETLNEIANGKVDDITKVIFYDGRGFNKPFTLEDKLKINDFTNLFNSLVIKKMKKHVDVKGWILHADLYTENAKLVSITFTDPLKINNHFYQIVKGNINKKELEEFVQSINSHWK